MAIDVRQSSVRLIAAILALLALVGAFLAIQVFLFHSLGSISAAITNAANHALALSPKPHCSGTPAPC
jgi:hypothetical protein